MNSNNTTSTKEAETEQPKTDLFRSRSDFSVVAKVLGGEAQIGDESSQETLKAPDVAGLSWLTRPFSGDGVS